MIDPEIRDIIAPELQEGEKLLWAGRPNPRVLHLICLQIGGGLILMAGLSVIFGLFLPDGGNGIVRLIRFLLIGCVPFVFAIVAVQEIQNMLRNKKNHYVITTERIIGKFATENSEYTIVNLRRGSFTLVERFKKLGSSIFTAVVVSNKDEEHKSSIIAYIDDGDHVEKLIQKFIA